MTVPPAADSPLSRAAAHLHAAGFLAADRAQLDPDAMLSPWANTADTITLAAMGLAPHLSGPAVPAEHPDCRAALLAAAAELALLRPHVDVPLTDLAFVMEHLAAALQHAHDDAADAHTGVAAAGAAGTGAAAGAAGTGAAAAVAVAVAPA